MKRLLLMTLIVLSSGVITFAQSDRSQVRRGNRDFRKEK